MGPQTSCVAPLLRSSRLAYSTIEALLCSSCTSRRQRRYHGTWRPRWGLGCCWRPHRTLAGQPAASQCTPCTPRAACLRRAAACPCLQSVQTHPPCQAGTTTASRRSGNLSMSTAHHSQCCAGFLRHICAGICVQSSATGNLAAFKSLFV